MICVVVCISVTINIRYNDIQYTIIKLSFFSTYPCKILYHQIIIMKDVIYCLCFPFIFLIRVSHSLGKVSL